MNSEFGAHVNRDTLVETFAAELALAAYRVALRSRTEGTWLELELHLWRAMADTIRSSQRMAGAAIAGDDAHAVQRRGLA